MITDRARTALAVLVVLSIPHVLLGIYAVLDDGVFGFGFNSPERYAYHLATGSEARFTISGAGKYIIDDLCLARCPQCPMDCYLPYDLRLNCSGGCVLTTERGGVLAREGDGFTAVMKSAVRYQDATFRCYDKVCGFDVKVGDVQTFSANLPEGIRQV